jgi:hypothetical protein
VIIFPHFPQEISSVIYNNIKAIYNNIKAIHNNIKAIKILKERDL